MSKQSSKSRQKRSSESKSPPTRQQPGRAQSDSDGDETIRPRFSFSTVLMGVVALGFVLRVVNVLLTVSVPTAATLVGDAEGYYAWAENIAAGNWYGDTTFYQAPLYPYFLAVLLKGGMGVTGMRLAQAALGACGVGLLGLAARQRFDSRTGVLAAVLLAVYPPAIYYDGIIQKAALASVLLCALLAAIGYLRNGWRLPVAGLMGVILGLLVLTRENALLWIPVVGVWTLLAPSSLTFKGRSLVCLAYVIGLAIPLLPVAARNASLGGEWSPTTFQAGPNFYIGNNLQSFGIYRPLVPGHETPLYERADAEKIAEATTGRKLSAREVSRFWMSRAIEDIRVAPGRWLSLMVQKSFMVINRFEVPDVESIEIYREQSPPLKLATVWNFGVLFPFAVAGLVCSLHRWREFWIDYAMILTMIGAIVLFFVLGRYRLPLVPLLIPMAAYGLISIFKGLRDKTQWGGLKKPILAAVAAAILCNLPVHDEVGLTASSLMNSAIAAARNRDTNAAIRLLNTSIEMEPSIAEAHYNLGRALLQVGRPRQAIQSLQNAQRLDPGLSMVDFLLGNIYEQLGEVGAAKNHYQRAIRIGADPERARQALLRLERGSE